MHHGIGHMVGYLPTKAGGTRPTVMRSCYVEVLHDAIWKIDEPNWEFIMRNKMVT